MGSLGHSVRPTTTRIWEELPLLPNQEPSSKNITLKTVLLPEDILATGSAIDPINVIYALAECLLICSFWVSSK
jgi:hypothetical protein